MTKRLLLVLAALFMASAMLPVVVSAEEPVEYVAGVTKDTHKVKSKWDVAGTFVSSRTWATSNTAWDFVPSGTTWNYELHIKQAQDDAQSVGVVHFWTTKANGTLVDIVGHVDAAKTNYGYWYENPATTPIVRGQPNLAAVGTANYDGTTYNFMLLHANNAVWVAFSQDSFDTVWAAGDVWGGSARTHDLLSTVAWANDFEIDPKFTR